MDRYIFNTLLTQICKDDFGGKGYQLSKALGHFDDRGKVLTQKVSGWLLKKVELRASTFAGIIEQLGYELKTELIKNAQIMGDQRQIEFEERALEYLERLVMHIANNTTVSIGTFQHGHEFGSIITTNEYSDENLCLLYMKGNILRLELNVADDDQGELVTYYYILEQHEVKRLPKGLINLMRKVQQTQHPEEYYIGGLQEKVQ